MSKTQYKSTQLEYPVQEVLAHEESTDTHVLTDSDGGIVARFDGDGKLYLVGLEHPVQEVLKHAGKTTQITKALKLLENQ